MDKLEQIETLNLIDGTFSVQEAQEVLLNIFNEKIKFHQLKNFSSQERYGKIDIQALNRIKDLKVEIEKIVNLINENKIGNKKFRIKSEISIDLID